MVISLAALAFGFFIGVLGTLVGAGGGFLIVPVVALVEPKWATQTITAFSLAVVAANAAAGVISYQRQRRIDLKSFPLFAAAAIPGAALGAWLSNFIPRSIFDLIFGVGLVAVAVVLFVNPARRLGRSRGGTKRLFIDRNGRRHEWSFDLPTGIAGAACVGVLSSLLGIGGGIVHVPFMVTVLSFPEHVATATSLAVLAVTAVVGAIVHVVQGDYRADALLTLLVAAGAVAGAPVGAKVSSLLPGRIITRILALALVLVGVRLCILSLSRMHG
ncbi:MAG: sulfite exporter TauE/SafE family protein [bacterium]|nr:sulfite exporter TauE/SafE family protein [bacterium]